MGVLDKFLNVMRLSSEDEDEYYDDYDDDYVEEEPVSKPAPRKERRETSADLYEADTSREKQVKSSAKVTPMRPSKKTSSSNMEVCVIKPNSMEDARDITDTLLSERTVLLNVEGLDVSVAQRIIDFSIGSSLAIHGKLEKISNYIFLITPPSVEISGSVTSMLDKIDTKGSINTDY